MYGKMAGRKLKTHVHLRTELHNKKWSLHQGTRNYMQYNNSEICHNLNLPAIYKSQAIQQKSLPQQQ